ncbi:MAG TPA: hypothetical protein VIK45_13350 [Candidatus Dormibacteraeota bacterium]
MSSSPSQVRLLVMVLVAWCALSAAPVVANSPSLPAAFFVIAVGLVAAVTLRFSTLVGLAMAVVGTALFAISMVLDPSSAAGRGGQGLGGTLSRLDQLLPALVAAVSLVGAAVCASLASWEIDGRPGAILDPALREAAREEAGELDDEPAVVQMVSGQGLAASRAGRATETQEAQAHPEAPATEPPIGSEEPAAVEQLPEAQAPQEIPPAEKPPAAVQEPAAAEEAGALHQSEGERGAAVEETKAKEPAPAGAEPPVREEPAAGVEPAASVERATEREGPPVEEPSVAREAPLAGETASTAGSQPGGGKKGKEIAARGFEEKNGRSEGDRLETARPDWSRRRRPDDDVARRVPRRRKR